MKYLGGQGGFSLPEMLVVVVLGAVIVASAYQVLLVNQQTYATNTANIETQQTVRAGIDVLFGELRELSTEEGDILAFSSDSLRVRVMRRFGLVCGADIPGGVITVRRVGEFFEVGDSVVVLADTDIDTSGDDVWVTGRVATLDTTQACNGTSAQRMTVANIAAVAANPTFDTVKVGAPVRSYVQYTYKLFTVGGASYLGRRNSSGAVVPIVGPLRNSTGLQFAYYDSLGAVATVPSQIAQMQVTLRALSGAIWQADGSHVTDSITTRIYQRN